MKPNCQEVKEIMGKPEQPCCKDCHNRPLIDFESVHYKGRRYYLCCVVYDKFQEWLEHEKA